MIGIYDINDFKNIDFKIRLETYKKVGFSSIGLYIDDKYMNKNENYENIIKFAIKIGLQVNQVHVDYKISNEICENTQKYLDYVEEKLLFCKKYEIKNMVLHASKGSNPPKVNDDQLKKLISLAKRFPEVNLSFENVRNNYNLEKILNLNQPNITLCYDIGHANAYNSSYLLNKYKNKISCAHLHNNYGNDDHNLLSNGNINYRKVINILASINCDCCLEVFPDKNFPQTMDFFVNFISRAYDDYIWRNWTIRKTNFKNHALNLQPTYFNLIKNKEKTLEVRLNDEKRKHFNVGDTITFYKEPEKIETINAIILDKYLYKDFYEMANDLDKKDLGFSNSTKEEMISVYRKIYTREDENKYGVVIFKIKVIS